MPVNAFFFKINFAIEKMHFVRSYRGAYRNPPEHPQKYELSDTYYMLLIRRLLFILIFEVFLKILLSLSVH